MKRSDLRIGAVCAVLGAVLLFVGTYLHPMQADPNDPLAAFVEYAADQNWVASHLTQLAGVALIVAALIVVSAQLESTGGAAVARIASGGAIASLAVAAALQAVDGIALKLMVDAWAAETSEKNAPFQATFGVRQVEIGLAGVMSLLFGATATLYGTAMWSRNLYPKWVAGLAVLGGAPTVLAGIIMAHSGFSSLAMLVSIPSSSVLLVWMFAVGVLLWRRSADAERQQAV